MLIYFWELIKILFIYLKPTNTHFSRKNKLLLITIIKSIATHTLKRNNTLGR